MTSINKAKKINCAIYTRKSSEEGLEQEFNSLHAQREACEAYILSQRHEGWELIKTQYDDGGFSGGNMDRPGLKQLMQDIEDGKIDIIVVYKVDRLTRSLADFAKIVELLDKKGISFVSITQQFNTTTSMGRLTLNVLLSFAQFEREVTGERIRDKIALSKQKGKWMGGVTPAGYEARERKLYINPSEAENIRKIFEIYLEFKSVHILQDELAKLDIKTPERVFANGRRIGGKPYSKGNLYKVLQNRIYIGDIVHKDKHYPGEHEAIIDVETFNQVQQALAESRMKQKGSVNSKSPCILSGKIFDDKGNYMSPKHSRTRKLHYRYYTSQAIIRRKYSDAGSLPNISAHEIETLVKSEIKKFLQSSEQLQPLLTNISLSEQNEVMKFAKSLELGSLSLRGIISKIVVSSTNLQISICKTSTLRALQNLMNSEPILHEATLNSENVINISRDIALGRINNGEKIIVGESKSNHSPELINAIVKSYRWNEMLETGEAKSVKDIMKLEKIKSNTYIFAILRLKFLSPKIIDSIISQGNPHAYTYKQLIKMNINSWEN